MRTWITSGTAALALLATPDLAALAQQARQPAPSVQASPADVARAPANINDLKRRTAAFIDRVTIRSQAFNEQLKAAQEETQDRKKAVENADRIIDVMLMHLRQSVEEGRPDSQLAQEIVVMMRMANELSLQAQNDNDEVFANIFKLQWQGFTALRNHLEGTYDRGLRAIRELEARKRTIRRAVQAEQIEIAYATLNKAISDYKEVAEEAAALAKAAADAS